MAKRPVTNQRIREVERAYLASHRAYMRYHKMIQSGAYNKMTPGQQEKFVRQFHKAERKSRESFNDVLRLRRKAAAATGRSKPFREPKFTRRGM